MTATEPMVQAWPASWSKAAAVGGGAGMLAAAVMAMFAMVAGATYLGSGFFTPLYHIASAFGWPQAMDAMMASMERASAGDVFHWVTAPALLGVGIHMLAGLGWGALFGLLVRAIRPARAATAALGLVFGIVVLLVMSFLVLPVVASLSGSGDPIRDMPSMVGWGTFTAEHLVFGFVLGLVVAAVGLARTVGVPSSARTVRARPHPQAGS